MRSLSFIEIRIPLQFVKRAAKAHEASPYWGEHHRFQGDYIDLQTRLDIIRRARMPNELLPG